MRVRRTGAGRGQSPIWYVWADQAEEQAAIRVGLLEEQSPSVRFRFVLAWGLPNQKAAKKAMEDLRPRVERVVAELAGSQSLRCARAVEARILADDARLEVHRTELRVLAGRLCEITAELDDERLVALSEEVGRWLEEERRLWGRVVNTMQAACILCAVCHKQASYSNGEANTHCPKTHPATLPSSDERK